MSVLSRVPSHRRASASASGDRSRSSSAYPSCSCLWCYIFLVLFLLLWARLKILGGIQVVVFPTQLRIVEGAQQLFSLGVEGAQQSLGVAEAQQSLGVKGAQQSLGVEQTRTEDLA